LFEEMTMIDTGLQDKVVLVTGGNNPYGIGAATAKALAGEGAKVFLTFLRLRPEGHGISREQAGRASAPSWAFGIGQAGRSADEVLSAIREAGGEAEAWEADLADPATIPELYDRAEAAFGTVEILVNNAAHVEHPDTVLTSSPAKIDRHFAVNTRAVTLMMKEYGQRHVGRGATWGRIINVSTEGAYRFTGTVSYGASKFAMESISRVAANELGPHGVTVNVVSLGMVQTGYCPPDMVEREAGACPMRRMGVPKDVADAIVFFASEQASWITGQRLYVNGGCVM